MPRTMMSERDTFVSRLRILAGLDAYNIRDATGGRALKDHEATSFHKAPVKFLRGADHFQADAIWHAIIAREADIARELKGR